MFQRPLLVVYALLSCIATHVIANEQNPYPVNWEKLPSPYHTKSAINPSRIIPRPENTTLSVPDGFIVTEYLAGFAAPRFMLLGPDNEILLSDMEAGIIYVIKDKKAHPLIKYLENPYGLALYKEWLYVATSNAVWRYPYQSQKNVGQRERIISLQKYNSGHITRSIVFDETTEKLYLSVGSKSNVAAGEPPIRAAISRYNPDGTGFELFATGIRNPIALQWSPFPHAGKKILWTTSHERDGLGDDLVPDYLTEVKQGAFYGWPYAYIGPHEDPRHANVAPDKVSQTRYPDVLLGGHVGVMEMIFYTGTKFPEKYQNGAFLALHGSWNREKRAGYKIVFVPFKAGRPQTGPSDFLTGWMLSEDTKEVWGRPVGILQMPDGSLLISDDGAGKLWQVNYADE
ncbi:L-sorbosone dehydrogenase [uncultured Candidatus Thioglobus sp.]|nr:L-sorbosone dehydrogenase [uncultured Candidatus Thioglobus sp.]